jgi:hypothetical protein
MPNYRTTLYHDHWLRLTESDRSVFVYRLNFTPHLDSLNRAGIGLTYAKARVPYSPFQQHSLCGVGFAQRLGIDVGRLNFTSTMIVARKRSSSSMPTFRWQPVDACSVLIEGVRLEEVTEYLNVKPFLCARTKPQEFPLLVAQTIPPAYLCIGREFFDSRFHPVRGVRASRFSRDVFYQAIAKDPALCDAPRSPTHSVVVGS